MASPMKPCRGPEIVSVNTSPGGIPKLPVVAGAVTLRGLDGDGHDHEKHDTPLQALSLIDVEDLEDLRAEGFAVGPGATGENVTVRGLSVDELSVGDRLRFAGGVEAELTKRRRPCYVLDAIDPALKVAIRDRCGFYARIVRPGTIHPGEAIEVERKARSRGGTEGLRPVTGCILAGGASRRMGCDKATLVLPGGGTMIERVAGVMARVCGRLVTAGAGGLAGVEGVADRRPGAGPLAGIEAMLLDGGDETYLVCPCDVPCVTVELLLRLAAPSRRPLSVLHIAGEAGPRPLPARIAVTALPVVQALLDADRRAVHGLLAALEVEVVAAPAAWAGQLLNVNAPEDLEALEARRLEPPPPPGRGQLPGRARPCS